jgi:hypothetical protein
MAINNQNIVNEQRIVPDEKKMRETVIFYLWLSARKAGGDGAAPWILISSAASCPREFMSASNNIHKAFLFSQPSGLIRPKLF